MNATQQPVASPELPQTRERHQPASRYVVPGFYDWLMEVSHDLAHADLHSMAEVSDGTMLQVMRLLTHEARLLDQGGVLTHAYERWLTLFADECAYWIPAVTPATDPRLSISLEFHDRRRLMDRIARLGTGTAFSQIPASRTSRQWSGLELWPSPGRQDEWRARCSFSLVESRDGHKRILAGWNGYVLRQTEAGLRIVLKQVNLLDNDRPQGNNSFFL